MVDLEDVPPSVLDLLKIFLASSSRGEKAILILETKNKAIKTKYMTMDTVVGSPAAPTSTRRSKLRLEAFKEKKTAEKKQLEETSTSHQQTSPLSLILQVDGAAEQEKAKDSFVSMYAEEDIMYTIEEIFQRTEVKCTLESRERIAPPSSDHLCILEIGALSKGRIISWPDFARNQAVVFEQLKRI
jgi:hypothetical protein